MRGNLLEALPRPSSRLHPQSAVQLRPDSSVDALEQLQGFGTSLEQNP